MKLISSLPDKQYEEDEFDYRKFDWWYEFETEYVDEYNLDTVLQQAGDDICEYEIEENP